jgi:hypothetical protein
MGKSHNIKDVNNFMNKEIANSVPVATLKDLQEKIMVNDLTAYIISDPFKSDPSQLLGQVVEIRKSDGVCPASLTKGKNLNFEFSIYPVRGYDSEAKTILSKPELRGSIIVDKKLSAEAGFLNFLSGQLDEKSCFSLMIMDQAEGLINTQHDSWKGAVKAWINDNQDKMNDPEICYIYVVTGFIQKNIIKKKYYQLETLAKGGGWGININGKLSTSSEEYSLDIIFGLSPSIIKRPQTVTLVEPKEGKRKHTIDTTKDERKLFALTSGTILTKDFFEKQRTYKKREQEILQE